MRELTPEEFNAASVKIASDIAKMVDDVENTSVVLSAYIPVVAQAILNASYQRQIDRADVMEIFIDGLKHTTKRMHLFMEKVHAEKRNEA